MIDREVLKRQQAVLKHLGYYNGAIDGYWSNKTMEAKIEYERSGKFTPAISNRGMPFNLNSKLPKGLYIDESGKLSIVGVTIKDETVENTKVVETQPVVAIVTTTTTTQPPIVQTTQTQNVHDRNADRNKNSGKQPNQPQKPPVA